MSKRLIYLMFILLLLGLSTNAAIAVTERERTERDVQPFLQDSGPDGIVSIEAENFDANQVSVYKDVDGTPTLFYWQEETNFRPRDLNDTPNDVIFYGPAMRAYPYTGYTFKADEDDINDIAPILEYRVYFVKSGTHYLWAKCWGDDGGTNSFYWGLDVQKRTAMRITPSHDNNSDDDPNTPEIEGQEVYDWDNDWDPLQGDGGPMQYDIDAGIHTINIWQREPGLVIDKLVITTNPDYDPNEVNDTNGPPESPRVDPALAKGPSPNHEEQNVYPKVLLSWLSGDYAVTHDVYFDTDFADVNDGTRASHPGLLYYSQNQSENYYPKTGVPLDLDYSQTYYWRIDEVNDNDPCIWKGFVWEFTVEPEAWLLTSDHIENVTASSSEAGQGPEKTADDSGMNENDEHSTTPTDMWLTTAGPPATIEYEFDRLYKLNKMKVWNYNEAGETDRGLKIVTIEYSEDGITYFTLGTTHTISEASGAPDYTGDTPIDFENKVAKYVRITSYTINGNHGDLYRCGLSEVRFYYIPLRARIPDPADEEGLVNPNSVVLKWRTGREAVKHEVYLSTNEQDVINGANESGPAYVGTVNAPTSSYNAGSLEELDLDTTYYWKIIEVNSAEDPQTWDGDVWEFDTLEYFVIDDMDNYGDDPKLPWEPGCRIMYKWQDGWADSGSYPGNDTGSQVGHRNSMLLQGISETFFVSSAPQSMPYYYENDGGTTDAKPFEGIWNNPDGSVRKFSEARANMSDLQTESDWTPADMLSLWFYGDPCNAIGANDKMYVVLEDMDKNVSAIVYYDQSNNYDPNDLREMSWHEWNIDITDFTGIDLNEVNDIYIGFGNRNTPDTGGEGVVYFDSIRLYPSGCVPAQSQPALDFDDDCDVDYGDLSFLTGHWLLDDSVGTGELMLHWKFDEDTDDGEIATDSSGKGRHGIYSNPDHYYGSAAPGLSGTSNDFDSAGEKVTYDDSVIDANEFMDGLHGLTVALWIHPDNYNDDNGFIVFDSNILDAQDDGDRRNIRHDADNDESNRLEVIICGVTATHGAQDLISAEEKQSNDWQHIAMTWTTGENVKLYLDGKLDYYAWTNDPPPLGTTIRYNGITVGKGKEDDGADEGFLGLIDDVQIYNYALSPAEIQTVKGGGTIAPKSNYHWALTSPAELHANEAIGSRVVNFKDIAVLVVSADWLDEPMLWP